MSHATADERYDLLLRRIEQKSGKPVKRSGAGHKGHCPGHDDEHESLTTAQAADGKLLIDCHAGDPCPFQRIVAALEMKPSDFFPPSPNGKNGHREPEIRYPYHDEQNRVLYRKIRKPNKEFCFDHTLDGVRRILYRIPNLLKLDPGQLILINEGEKATDRCWRAGIPATNSPFGGQKGSIGKKWLPEFTAWLKEHRAEDRFAVVADNDETGESFAPAVTALLRGAGLDAFTLRLPDLPRKGDVYDWLEAGGTKEILFDLAEAAEAEAFDANSTEPAALESADEEPETIILDETSMACPEVELQELEEFLDWQPSQDFQLEGRWHHGALVGAYGAPGCGKSYVGVDLVMTQTKPLSHWHGMAIQPGPAVYIAAEAADALVERFQAWRNYHGADREHSLRIYPAQVDFPDDRAVIRLVQKILAMAHLPTLIVVDTLAETFGGLNESATQDMERYIRACRYIQFRTKATLLILHHENRTGEYRGNSVLLGAVDLMLHITQENGIIKIEPEKRRRGASEEPILLTLIPSDPAPILGQPGETRGKLTVNQRAILTAIANSLLPPKSKDLIAATELADRTYHNIRQRLEQVGWVEGVGGDNSPNRTYYLTAAGRRVLESDRDSEPKSGSVACGRVADCKYNQFASDSANSATTLPTDKQADFSHDSANSANSATTLPNDEDCPLDLLSDSATLSATLRSGRVAESEQGQSAPEDWEPV